MNGTKKKYLLFYPRCNAPNRGFDRIFNNDSSMFLKELEDNSFYEIKDSFSNYGSTYYNIGSILHLGNFEKYLKLNSSVSYKHLYPTVLRKVIHQQV